jgi:threonine aldolase
MHPPLKIDLFSDTNTNPTPEMRHFMCQAEVGNEVAGEDPTVNLLLERVCTLLKKERAVFLPSGTMCNGIALRVLCKRPGDTIVLDKTAHPLLKASGLVGGLVQAVPHTVEGKRGVFSLKDIEPIFNQPRGYNISVPQVVSLEQTTNFGGGAIWPMATIREVCDFAHHHQAYTHLDGARLFHAVAKTKITADQYAKPFDLLWVDFSKFGAPMGAVLAGSQELIEEAWYYKFQQGGGMHQAGIIAAGCLYALDYHIPLLDKVHAYTKNLAILLNALPYIRLDPEQVETNIICFDVDHPTFNAYALEAFLKERGIRIFPINEKTVRAILHHEITDAHVTEIFEALKLFQILT